MTKTAMIATKLEAGQPAPPFELPDHTGAVHRLDLYAGKWLVLYFYPRDSSPLCTREACGFRDDMDAIEALGARVAGVSLDSRDSHATFRDKYHLPFPLLSDSGGETARRYGTYFQIACLRLVKRHTFLIDPQGRIARIYRSVSSSRHSAEIIEDLRALQTDTARNDPTPDHQPPRQQKHPS